MSIYRHVLRAALIAMLFAVFAVLVQAQVPTSHSLDDQITAAETNDTLTPAIKTEVLKTLESAKTELTAQQNLAADLEQMKQTASNQETIKSDLETQLLESKIIIALPEDDAQSTQISRQLSILEAERSTANIRLTELRGAQTQMSAKASTLPQSLAGVRESLAALGESKLPETSDPLTLARQSLTQSRRARLIQERDTLSLELETIPLRKDIITKQIAVLEARFAAIKPAILALQTRLSETRMGRADDVITDAQNALDVLPSNSDALSEFASQNLALAQERRAFAVSEAARGKALSLTSARSQDIQRSTQTVERILGTGSLTEELGVVLKRVRSDLPKPVELKQTLLATQQAQTALQLKQILWQERLRVLEEREPLEPATEGLSSTTSALEQGIIESRKSLLTGLIEDAQSESDQIAAQELALRDLLLRTETLGTQLDRRLLWLRTSAPLGMDWFTTLPTGFGTLFSAQNWSTAFNAGKSGFTARPIFNLLVVIFAIALLVLSRRLHGTLENLAEQVGNVGRDTYWTTPLAGLITLINALPIPLLLVLSASLLAPYGQDKPFTSALSAAFMATGAVVFILLLFREMARPQGLFAGHFGWSDLAALRLRRALTWFTIVQGVAAFIFSIAASANGAETRYSVGLIAFVIGAAAIVLFVWKLFKPTNGVFSEVVKHNPKGQKLLASLFPILLIGPLINGVLPMRGYFDTASALQTKVFQSGAVLFLSAVFFGLLMRLYLVAQRRYTLQKAKAHRKEVETARLTADKNEASGDAVPSELNTAEPDPERLSAQTKNVLLSIAGAALAFGLWMIWSPVIPALGIADDIVLWQTQALVDGLPVTRGVTLWNVLLCFGLLFGGFIIARNIRGFLEVGLFARMRLDPGTRYAAVTIAGYFIVMIGTIAGLAQLGVDWSRLQWVVAALGVGLGFGLQEIVANFICGLIILFERPVRVGDTVTIGELSGTVNSIRIRASTITDWDNRDIIIPNKTLITQNVTNWTLNNNVTRIMITIGVAYGSDIDQVRSIIETVLAHHPDVLDTPAPTVFFMRHSASSLDFEMRIFVGNPGKRLPLTHDINAAINRALKENDISIPFPQSDIHVHGLSPAVSQVSAKVKDAAS
jgi:potassium efflux system protein